MLKKLRIGQRLLFLITVQTLVLLIISVTALWGLNVASNTTGELNQVVSGQVKLSDLTEAVRGDLLSTVNDLHRGTTTWEEARANLANARKRFERIWGDYAAALSSGEESGRNNVLERHLTGLRQVFSELNETFEAESRSRLSLYVLNDLDVALQPFLKALQASVSGQQLVSETAFQESIAQNRLFLYSALGVAIFGVLVAALLGAIIYRSISQPIQSIAATVHEVSEGDYYARTQMRGRDELSELGEAFDGLLEDKVATLVQSTEEKERLNDSVINLLHAVAQLSRRDLTIKVPVTEDVTGPVADALNLMTGETSKVLQRVQRVSEMVSGASATVKSQSDTVISVAATEQKEVESTAAELAVASEAMVRIAKMAQACHVAADRAIKTTEQAQETVSKTVGGIDSIRDTIRETEKRIKRLGERSQEISGVVNLINSIAERTHILALNASMHAASAGEAGRGFAVVADEVQRLAENAREATSEISTLVNNIQVETADTVSTMNEAISRVVGGSQLAAEAGQQMQETQTKTSELVAMVRKIAVNSREQARTSDALRKRTGEIRKTSQETTLRLQEQGTYTAQLVTHADNLLDAVRVFKLPEYEQADIHVAEAGSQENVVPIVA